MDLQNMSVAELKVYCKTNGITGYTHQRKQVIIDLILSKQAQEPRPYTAKHIRREIPVPICFAVYQGRYCPMGRWCNRPHPTNMFVPVVIPYPVPQSDL